jgi:molybdate transport system substrate-binding protein
MRVLLTFLLLLPAVGYPEVATIATASNFRTTLNALGPPFEARTGHRFVIVSGSTGQLYAQIINGAPFDVFLAADQHRPTMLEGRPQAVADSRFTYAIGRLAVIARDQALILDDAGKTLAQAGIRKLVIANPAVAPYGVASKKVLHALGIGDDHFATIVLGENVAQVMTMVRTGNAELGLVALSLAQFRSAAGNPPYVAVPENLHDPVRQDAMLLSHGEDNPAAQAFVAFLKSPEGRRIIEAAGYGVE